jgi:GntR family transcriptional repressor for pyruvate dehydrogenase complex
MIMASKKPLFASIKTRRAFEKVSGQVKELIFSGVFMPGDKLPSERELASQFGVARIVVREALRVLEHSGFIFIRQGSEGGAFVKEVGATVVTQSLSDMMRLGKIRFDHLTEARLGIEKMTLGFVVTRADAEDLALLKENVAQSEKVLLTGKRATEENVSFHVLLAKASKNPLLEMIQESISRIVYTLLQSLKTDVEYSTRVVQYHRDICRAVCDRDGALAGKLMEEHILDVTGKLAELSETGKPMRKSRKLPAKNRTP